MTGTILGGTISYVTVDCTCGFEFAVPKAFDERRRKDRKNFFCPMCGRPLAYLGPSEADKLKEELAATKSQLSWVREDRERAKRDAKHFEARANGYKGQLVKVKKRAANGACPCCTRYFENLHRHMQAKHPDYAVEEPSS